LSFGTQAATGKIGIVSKCFHRGSFKIHFLNLENYLVKNLKTISGHTESTVLILYELTPKPISGETVPLNELVLTSLLPDWSQGKY
jgi:hypothetical protein